MTARQYRVVVHDASGPRLALSAATAHEALAYAQGKRAILSAKVEILDGSGALLSDEDVQARLAEQAFTPAAAWVVEVRIEDALPGEPAAIFYAVAIPHAVDAEAVVIRVIEATNEQVRAAGKLSEATVEALNLQPGECRML